MLRWPVPADGHVSNERPPMLGYDGGFPAPWSAARTQGSIMPSPSVHASPATGASPVVHLVTGATGFLGRAMVLELLRRTRKDRILCMVRPVAGEDLQRRLLSDLDHAASSYAVAPGLLAEASHRCVAVGADLRSDVIHLRNAIGEPLTYVWHCAASLRYHERDRLDIEGTNIVGTAALLTATRSLGARWFHYISTAFVAGERVGTLLEEPIAEVVRRNVYEESKGRAEQLVLAAEGPSFHTTVMRPSVVVGHSRTGAVSGRTSGVYGLWLQLGRAAPALLGVSQWRLQVDPLATLNIVPVDSVVSDAVACGLASTGERVFHLTALEPTAVADILAVFCELTGLVPPTCLSGPRAMGTPWTPAEEKLHQAMGFYATYLMGDKRFVRTHTDTVVGAARRASALDRTRLTMLCQWFIHQSFALPTASPVQPAAVAQTRAGRARCP